ncbi:MAG: M3 family metallopeptidase, partial [Thermomicrobiales bacterium]
MSAAELATKNLPHWDMTPYFPGLDSSEFNEAVQGVAAQCSDLEQKTGAVTIGAPIDDATVSAFEGIQASLNELIEKTLLVQSYVYGFLSVNSRDELAQARASEMQKVMARLSKVQSRVTAWLGSLDVEVLIATSDVAADHAFLLRKSKIEAQHMMPQAEEDLAADLTISGGSAFGKLHDDLASQIIAHVERQPGEFEDLPISEVRNLAMDPDRDVRRRAFDAEIEAWKFWSTPFAATLNGVKGEHGTLASRRGWDEVLDQSLFQNHVDRKTLDAMMGAAKDAFPDIRRYLKAKAKALGLQQLAWYDLTAPLSADDRTWTWDQSVEFVNEQFGSFSPKMRALSERAFNENWIDAEPRAGKIGGAFCMETRG